MSILGINSAEYFGYPWFSRINAIMSWIKPNGMEIWDADAVIIFVNDPDIWAYSWIYGFEINYRRGQPIHPVVIQAPVGHNPTDTDYHDHVISDAIVHELGHAIAKLDDEYVLDSLLYKFFNTPAMARFWSRNCDWTDYMPWSKFQAFSGKGYDDLGNDYSFKLVEGGLYNDTWIYRTSKGSIMLDYKDYDHFNPVSAYHMAASIKTRIGNVPYSLPINGIYGESIWWDNYTLDQFITEFPPEEFK